MCGGGSKEQLPLEIRSGGVQQWQDSSPTMLSQQAAWFSLLLYQEQSFLPPSVGEMAAPELLPLKFFGALKLNGQVRKVCSKEVVAHSFGRENLGKERDYLNNHISGLIPGSIFLSLDLQFTTSPTGEQPPDEPFPSCGGEMNPCKAPLCGHNLNIPLCVGKAQRRMQDLGSATSPMWS